MDLNIFILILLSFITNSYGFSIFTDQQVAIIKNSNLLTAAFFGTSFTIIFILGYAIILSLYHCIYSFECYKVFCPCCRKKPEELEVVVIGERKVIVKCECYKYAKTMAEVIDEVEAKYEISAAKLAAAPKPLLRY
ncbi:hypothetical protein XELAEV_18038758mg [Xenopus laevis]|uniref:Uncharacterized protein n=1 Tax=Xenopus laevis TaxID=8355 RepID=A0A974C6C6_XENLA|nr:hypothetical protein XELAEV_18038758mg [Xenopus laevis]